VFFTVINSRKAATVQYSKTVVICCHSRGTVLYCSTVGGSWNKVFVLCTVAIDIMTSQGMYSIVVGGSWNKVFVLYCNNFAYSDLYQSVVKELNLLSCTEHTEYCTHRLLHTKCNTSGVINTAILYCMPELHKQVG
jgi:hypothetical protein